MLRWEPGGGVRVADLVRSGADGDATADPGVQAGDCLLAVDGAAVTGRTHGEVADALRGRPGDRRRLTLARGGQRVEVEVAAARLL